MPRRKVNTDAMYRIHVSLDLIRDALALPGTSTIVGVFAGPEPHVIELLIVDEVLNVPRAEPGDAPLMRAVFYADYDHKPATWVRVELQPLEGV